MSERDRIAAALFNRNDPTANAAIGNVMQEERRKMSHKQDVVNTMLAVARVAGYSVKDKIVLEEMRGGKNDCD